MPPEKYTVLVVSEDGEETRRFRVSRRAFRTLIVLVAIVLITVVGLTVYFMPRIMGYARLRDQNRTLMEERIKVASLLRDLQRIREMDSYIRHSLGMDLEFALEPEAEGVPGAGSDQPDEDKIPVSFLENVPSYTPVDGFITQDFHRGLVSRTEDHFGLDIAARAGTAIHAAASGLVVFSGWTYGYGNMVIIYHGDDYFSLYGHNQKNLVKERQVVERGEIVALVGESGLSTGPHLHFEIWKDGKPVDPREFILSYTDENLLPQVDGKK